MIVTETFDFEGRTLVKTYSNAGVLIRKKGTDEIYAEAVDPEGTGREYVETDIPIEPSEDFTDADALAILTGIPKETDENEQTQTE